MPNVAFAGWPMPWCRVPYAVYGTGVWYGIELVCTVCTVFFRFCKTWKLVLKKEEEKMVWRIEFSFWTLQLPARNLKRKKAWKDLKTLNSPEGISGFHISLLLFLFRSHSSYDWAKYFRAANSKSALLLLFLHFCKFSSLYLCKSLRIIYFIYVVTFWR